MKEMQLLVDWYLPKNTHQDQLSQLTEIFEILITNAINSPQVFVHRDYHSRNLMITRQKISVIDFQDAFWGESCWDLFSLLEDSRVSFSNKYNEEMIEYFYLNTNQKITLHDYKLKYHFLNCSRQTRLLGRWVKLAKKSNIISYLDFIYVTKKRLKFS
jgi:hypothetical protein